MAIRSSKRKFFFTGICANGVVAIGVTSHGIVSIGIISHGIVSIGIISMGVFSAALVSMGVLAAGVVSMGLMASEGCTVTIDALALACRRLLGQVEGLLNSEQWAKLTSIAMVEAIREEKGQTSRAVRFYISSLEPEAQKLAEAIRTHWSVENPLHWVLDVAFNEDDCRIRTDHAPENLVLLRHLAVSALNQEKTAKLGIKNKRLRAGWDNDYLLKVLAG